MWVKLAATIFVICLLAAVYCIYRLHLYAGPKSKKADKQKEIDRQQWLQQKQQVFEESRRFLDNINLPVFLLEPRIQNQQLELLKFPNNKRFGDWRYESNEEIMIGPLQGPLGSFLQSLQKKGLSVKGFEEEFLNDMVHGVAVRNYKYHADKLGDFAKDEQDLGEALLALLDSLGIDKDDLSRPKFMESLNNYYKEPMIFKSTARDNHDFVYGIGLLDFLQKYFKIKGITDSALPIKELSDKLEEAFNRYQSMHLQEP